jgi:ABC-type molybdate transport system substrate-binding protein
MKKWIYFLIAFFMCLPVANAAENKEIESITVLAESKLAVPLSQLSSNFTHQTTVEKILPDQGMIGVATVFGNSVDQKKKIEDGESADIFITSDASLIQNLKIKGMIDVYSIGEIANNHSVHYTAAVVASENMTPARKFLEYLKSAEAQKIFKANGLTTPQADDSSL